MRMWKFFFLVIAISTSFTHLKAQDTSIYNIRLAIDIPIAVAGVALTGYGFHKISEQDDVDSATIFGLNALDISKFDRGATRQYSERAENISDILFYGAFPYPLVLLLDKKIRKDAWKIGLLYLQAVGIASAGYSNATGHTSRYRPYTYNLDPIVPMGDKTSLHARNSFYGGHPTITAVSTFFVAKVYSDHHPDSWMKYLLYGVAVTSSASCAYLRYKAGKHFPTDLILGVSAGALIGTLVPHFHKARKDKYVSILPFSGEVTGLAFSMDF